MTFYFFSNHKAATSFSFRVLKSFCIINNLNFHTTATGRLVLAPPDGGSYTDKDLVFYRNAEYAIAGPLNIHGVRIIRNPLSTVASAYFSHLKTHKTDGWPLLEEHRKILKVVSKETGMALTLQFLEQDNFYRETSGPLYALAQWNDFDSRFLTIRMEDMVKRPNEFLTKAIEFHGKSVSDYRLIKEEKFSFKAIAGRDVGTVNTSAHLRSGNPNDWRSTLPEYIKDYIKAHYWQYLERYYPEALE